MDIFRIVGIGVIAAVLALVVKQHRPELAIQISIVAAILIFLSIAPYFMGIIRMFEDLTDQLSIDVRFFDIVLKIIGVAYIAQLGAELCRDAGEGAIASKIELAAKVILLVMAMPIVYSLISLITGLLN